MGISAANREVEDGCAGKLLDAAQAREEGVAAAELAAGKRRVRRLRNSLAGRHEMRRSPSPSSQLGGASPEE